MVTKRSYVCFCVSGVGVDHRSGSTDDNNSDDHISAYYNDADSIRYSDLYYRTVVTTSVSQPETTVRKFIGHRLHSTLNLLPRQYEHSCSEITLFNTNEWNENCVARP